MCAQTGSATALKSESRVLWKAEDWGSKSPIQNSCNIIHSASLCNWSSEEIKEDAINNYAVTTYMNQDYFRVTLKGWDHINLRLLCPLEASLLFPSNTAHVWGLVKLCLPFVPHLITQISPQLFPCTSPFCPTMTDHTGAKLKRKALFTPANEEQSSGDWGLCSVLWRIIVQSWCQESFPNLCLWCLEPWFILLFALGFEEVRGEGDNASVGFSAPSPSGFLVAICLHTKVDGRD
jgi:hypothetical protein